MKTIPLIFAGMLLAESVRANPVAVPTGCPTEIDPSQDVVERSLNGSRQRWIGPVLVIIAGTFAGCIILYAYRAESDPWEAHQFVLYRDRNDDNWVPISTNTVALSPRKAKLLFCDTIRKDGGYESGCRYRVRDMGPVEVLP